MYPPAPPRLFLYLPFHCLLRPPVFSGPKSMDFLFFLSSDFCCCCIIIVYIILYLEIILNNFFCTTNHRERHIYMFSNKGCINCLEIALFLLKVQFISLSRRHGISFQKKTESGAIKGAKALLIITDGKSKSLLSIIFNKA